MFSEKGELPGKHAAAKGRVVATSENAACDRSLPVAAKASE
jgi:hypothetical protein